MLLRRVAAALVLISWFTTSVSAQPASSEALDKGFQALQSGDAARAASIFREALTRHPGDPQLLLGAGVAAGIQGQDKDAIAFLSRALQIEPQFRLAITGFEPALAYLSFFARTALGLTGLSLLQFLVCLPLHLAFVPTTWRLLTG